MSWLKTSWFNVTFLIVVLLIVGVGLFFLLVRAKCSRSTTGKLSKIEDRHSVSDWQRLYNLSYQKCLNSYGL